MSETKASGREADRREDADGPADSQRGHTLPADIATLPSADRRDALRIIEARLFAASSPVSERDLASSLAEASRDDIRALLDELKAFYAGRGINLVRVAGKWSFRTAEDLAFVLERHAVEQRRLSKAAMETLAIIAYHQPATRAEIEEVRGVAISKGTLDVLMEIGWIRPRGRRRAPGRPLTYGTTESFLSHFGLDTVGDLPGMTELKAAGLLDATLPADFRVPNPKEVAALMPDELPLDEAADDEAQDAFQFEADDHEADMAYFDLDRDEGDERSDGDDDASEDDDAPDDGGHGDDAPQIREERA